MRAQATTSLLLLLAACGGAGGGDAAVGTTRDSAGVAIVEYPAGAIDKAPAWDLSAEPLTTVGGDVNDTELDLSTSGLGLLLSDNRLVAATTINPAQVYLFAADGKSRSLIGGPGEGPGEYRLITGLTRLGGDTVAVYDLMTRKALLFTPDGQQAGRLQLPFGGDATRPPQLIGRTKSGTWVFQAFDQLNLPPDDAADPFRKSQPLMTWREGSEKIDSFYNVLGPLSIRSTVDFGGQSIPIGRPLAYGANSTHTVSGDIVWTTPGDSYTLSAHDLTGALVREVRVAMAPRPVTDADREHFKQVQRQGLERARGMGLAPPQVIESEIAKVDQTKFADVHPVIGQLTSDLEGRLWVTTGFPGLDSTLTYAIFSPEGALLGRVTLPDGIVLGASNDRVVVRREDDATGLVSLQVWGLRPGCKECGPTDQ